MKLTPEGVDGGIAVAVTVHTRAGRGLLLDDGQFSPPPRPDPRAKLWVWVRAAGDGPGPVTSGAVLAVAGPVPVTFTPGPWATLNSRDVFLLPPGTYVVSAAVVDEVSPAPWAFRRERVVDDLMGRTIR
jgi:hypothetical protein